MAENENPTGQVPSSTAPKIAPTTKTPLPNWVFVVGGSLLTIMAITVLWISQQPPIAGSVDQSTTVTRPGPTVSPTPKAATALARLKQHLADVPNTLVVYPDKQRPDEFPPDAYTGPVSVIAVDTRATSCEAAKRLSYGILRDVYSDSSLKGLVEKVLITSPGYLRVSLGKIDGEGLTEKNGWSGVTNFYTLLFDRFEGEPDSVLDQDATWVVSISSCR